MREDEFCDGVFLIFFKIFKIFCQKPNGGTGAKVGIGPVIEFLGWGIAGL